MNTILKFKSIKIFAFLILLTLSSCYSFRVASSENSPSTDYNKKTINSYFWGLVQKRSSEGIDAVAINCDSLNINALSEVKINQKFGYSLITVMTLGIWCPMQVEWRCTTPAVEEGNL